MRMEEERYRSQKQSRYIGFRAPAECDGLGRVALYVIKIHRVHFSPQGTDAKYMVINNNG